MVGLDEKGVKTAAYMIRIRRFYCNTNEFFLMPTTEKRLSFIEGASSQERALLQGNLIIIVKEIFIE